MMYLEDHGRLVNVGVTGGGGGFAVPEAEILDSCRLLRKLHELVLLDQSGLIRYLVQLLLLFGIKGYVAFTAATQVKQQ